MRRDSTNHMVMTPPEFIQRLAARVPRPRLHLIRLHGVLTPNAKLHEHGQLRCQGADGDQRLLMAEAV